MKTSTKKLLTILVISVVLALFSSTSFAVDLNLISSEYDNNDAYSSNNDANSDNSNQPANTPTTSSSQTNQDFFTPENILSIFLITIGIVLILLAIAIFIRIK